MEHLMNREGTVLSIDEVSRRIKIPKHTLRFWEKVFHGILIPLRTRGGQRRYAPENIAMLMEIDRLRRNGMGLSEIRRRLDTGGEETPASSNKIDLLANRVAEVVKSEVSHFLGKSQFFDVPEEIK